MLDEFKPDVHIGEKPKEGNLPCIPETYLGFGEM
jgi:hypothetical protein